MSDDSPPPKPKPGSLRDRIAAFEQKPPSNAPISPPLRPKPGHVQWKPRSSSPPPQPINTEGGSGDGNQRMSAADAKESIGLGGLSLKERMAALQGRGAFAAPPPPAPKPAGDKPKWKPPPAPVAPSDNEGETETDHEAHASIKSPISPSEGETGETISDVTDGEKSAVHGQEEGEAAAEGGDDPEEEERQRRAAIAARLARLGGARIGMGPPVFAPKPRASTASQPSVKEEHVLAESADEVSPSEAPDSAIKADLPSAPSETSLLSADSGSSARTPPVSMPVPSGPRRAGPPRRRPPKSPGPPSNDLPPTPEADGPTTPLDAAERDEKKLEDEKEEVAEEETEEEAAARRKRIADRIAKSGGINPFAGPRPQEEEEQEAGAGAEVEAEAAVEAGVESDAEVPPPSSDGADVEAEVEGADEDEITPPPSPSKLTNKEAVEAKKDVESPVAVPTKEEEVSAPVVDLSKPAVVSASLEDAEKNTTDITEAVGDYKDVIAHADVESEPEKPKKVKGAEVDEKEEKDGYLEDGEVTEIDYGSDCVYDADEDEDGEGEDGEEIGYYLIDEKMNEENNDGSHEAVTNSTHAVGTPPTADCSRIPLIDADDDDGYEDIKQRVAGEHGFVEAADDNELSRKHGSNLNDVDDELQKMVPPRIKRPLPPTPSSEHVNGVDEDVDADSNEEQVSQPTSDSSPPATGTLNGNGEHDQSHLSPPPPPPHPPPPLPTPPGTKEQRIARRQSTTSAHTRSATDPSSSSSSSLASSTQNNINTFPGLKRNNTISSFTPPRSPEPGRINGNTNTNGHGRRPGSPPPVVKPKPASLSLKNQNQKRKTHERASSTGATPLLRTALMQGAAAAAAATAVGGKAHSVGTDSEKERTEEPPERRASVLQLAKSLESVIQFGTPPGSPGSTPGRRASAQSLAKKKKAVKDSERESMNDGEDTSDEKGDKSENKRRSPSPRRSPSHSLSPELKAAVALVAAAKVASAASTRASSPPPPPRPPRASFVPVSAPRPPTPPVSPPTTTKAQAVSSSSVPSPPSPPIQASRPSSVPSTPAPAPPPSPPPPSTVLSSASTDSFVSAFTSTSPPATEEHFAPVVVVPAKTKVTTTATPKRYSVPPPPRLPPPPPVDADTDTDTDADGDVDGDEITVKINGVETTPKPPQRDMQPLPPPTPIAEKPEEEEDDEHDKEAKAELESEPEPDKANEEDAESDKGTFGGIVVQEPEEMSGIEDELMHRDSDSADEGDDSTDSEEEDEKQESFKSARSNNDSSCPPTPPVKQSFSFQLTSKWSRNTSVVASPNASAITLAHSPSPTAQSHEQSQDDTLAVHSNEDESEDEDEDEDEKDKHDNESNVNNVHDDYDPRFPPVSSFPPPPPLPFKKRSTSASPPAFPGERRLGFGPKNAGESETSLASLPEGDASDEGDGGSDVPRFKSKTKTTLTSAIAAALGRSQPEISSYTLSQTVTDSASRSSSEETNPLARQVRARLAKLDGFVEKTTTNTRPAPFPSVGDGNQGQSQSAPEVPQLRLGQEGMSTERKRQVRLSSKLLPITAAKRMNTMPAGVTAWGKNKAVMSSETVGTIGTIGTEPGDLEMSQFGSVSRAPSSFLNKRPGMRRQTTSQSSRFVEDLSVPLPFFKRSIDQRPQRATTISFSNRTRTGSEVGGPPTRKMSLVTGMRAATIEAVERPISAISGDFVLVEEPEEFDIPRAEWDLPRIPSGSLGFPSTVDLSKPNWAESSRSRSRPGSPATIHNRSLSSSITSNEGGRSGPSSAPATTAPSMPMAPLMAHSRSATTGTSGTSRTVETAKTFTSAPPGPISSQTSTGSESSPRLSSDALLDLWGRVGVYVSDAAALLHDKSRRVLVGDGTYPGFVLAVARQVPVACIPSRSARYPYGHLIYFQTAATVHKRYAGIMPGDVIVLQNALFKGVRGPLHQSYQEEIGTKGDPVVGVIGEFEARKSKVRVYQANQHVGVQTVEYVSYRFENLKSGTIKIFRVPDS